MDNGPPCSIFYHTHKQDSGMDEWRRSSSLGHSLNSPPPSDGEIFDTVEKPMAISLSNIGVVYEKICYTYNKKLSSYYFNFLVVPKFSRVY